MKNIIEYGLREENNSIKSMYKLVQLNPIVDWASLRQIVKEL